MLSKRTHIRLIVPYHFEKSWNVTQPFRDLIKLFDEGTASKSQVEGYSRCSNRATPHTSQDKLHRLGRKGRSPKLANSVYDELDDMVAVKG